MGNSKNKKILVVEDEPEIAQLVTHYLDKEGYRTATALNGFEAIKKVKEDKPDLLVLDLMHPELDGLRCANGCVRRPIPRCCRSSC